MQHSMRSPLIGKHAFYSVENITHDFSHIQTTFGSRRDTGSLTRVSTSVVATVPSVALSETKKKIIDNIITIYQYI